MIRFLAAAVVALACVASAAADTLTLKNGSVVNGTYLGGDSRELKFIGQDGRVDVYPVSDVSMLSFSGSAPAAASSSSAIAAPQPTAASTTAAAGMSIPSGTVISIRMIESIDSDVTDVGERFRASLEDPLVVDGRQVAPKGSDAVVKIARVDQAGAISGRDEVAVELAALTVNGKEVEVVSNFAEVQSKSKGAQTAKTAGIGAAIGAGLGAVIGGGKGAVIGAATGGGAGTVYSATRGTKVQIPSETLLTFVLQKDVAF